MAASKPTKAKVAAGKTAIVEAGTGSRAADGYEGVDWKLYDRVRPNHRHTGATGAGLVEYALWLVVIENRPESDQHDIGLPGQPVR